MLTLPTNGTPTSLAAALSMRHRAPIDRARVLAYIQSQGLAGATCDEAEQALGLSHQSCSARFHDLHTAEVPAICLAGRTRATRSGRSAAVYIATYGA